MKRVVSAPSPPVSKMTRSIFCSLNGRYKCQTQEAPDCEFESLRVDSSLKKDSVPDAFFFFCNNMYFCHSSVLCVMDSILNFLFP